MRRALFLALALVLTALAGGCWIFIGPDDDCGSWYDDCDWFDCGWNDGYLPPEGSGGSGGGGVVGTACVPGTSRYCDTPTYCSWGQQRCNEAGDGWSACHETSAPAGCGGFAFDQHCCMAAGECCQDWLDLDRDGDWDDSVGNCEEVRRCAEDAACPGGYCLGAGDALGVCRPTTSCERSSECAAMGPGFACDDRGLCAPESSPCPSGECGCADDAECAAGLLCIASRCTRPESVCFFDFECGEAAVCLDNRCHGRCEDDPACPAGQACAGGLCLEPAAGLDGCVYDEDCGPSRVCLNATCFSACAADTACGDREVCHSGACRPDPGPLSGCAEDRDCPTDTSCRRGVCRLPCVADINCGGAMPLCGAEGFCLAEVEVAPACVRAEDCGPGRSCLGNSCVVP